MNTITGGTMNLSNVEFVANFVELSDSAMGIIAGNLEGSPLQFTFPSYKNYQYAQNITPTTDTQINIPIPAKFTSYQILVIVLLINSKKL